jgi:predicted O-methyltransferase YrrM
MVRGIVLLLSLLAAAPGWAQALSDAEYDQVLVEMENFAKQHERLNVPRDHGQFLEQMTVITNAKRVLEMGTANGYSSLWIAKALRTTGGKLDTIEYDQDYAAEAVANFKKAKVDHLATVYADDAFKVVPKLKGPYDLIFIDVGKYSYLKLFEMTLPLLRPGGVFLAHDAIRQPEDMPDFLQKIKTHPDVLSSIVQMGDNGFAMVVRKRPK